MRPRPDEFELSGMRHRAGFLAAGDYDDGSSAALDEQEQEDLIRTLQVETDSVNVIARWVLCVLGGLSWLSQFLSSNSSLSFSNFISLITVLFLVPLTLHLPKLLPRPFNVNRAFALATALLALPPIIELLGSERMDWLTLAPMAVAGLSWLAERWMMDVDEELRELERRKYSFKGA